MKKLILTLFLSFAMNTQDNDIYKPNSEMVTAEASIIISIGRLVNKFDYAQSYGFWFKIGEDNGFATNNSMFRIIMTSFVTNLIEDILGMNYSIDL